MKASHKVKHNELSEADVRKAFLHLEQSKKLNPHLVPIAPSPQALVGGCPFIKHRLEWSYVSLTLTVTFCATLGFTASGLGVQEEVADELLAEVVAHGVQDELLKEESTEGASTCWLSPSRGAEIFDEVDKGARRESQIVFKKGVSGHKATIRELAPVDLGHQAKATRTGPNLVAKSTNSRPQFSRPLVSKVSLPNSTNLLQQGQMAYAMRQNNLHVWQKGRVEAVLPGTEGGGELQYQLRFEGRRVGKRSVRKSKVLSPRHLAFTEPSTVDLKVGTRCIGLYSEHDGQEGAFYSGIIAEPQKTLNGNRYLVFFDDGCASYVAHQNVREVCEMSTNVWEDIHPNSREFIRQYLQQYPERPMVNLVVGQVVTAELDGKWLISKVKQVDASLVKLVFDVDGRTEWIYRGSSRLGPLFKELEQQQRMT